MVTFLISSFMKKKCSCEETSGAYTDKSNAWYKGPATPLAFLNDTFFEAIDKQPQNGEGKRFEAFIISKKCSTFKKESK